MVFVSSCREEVEPTIAQITVVTKDGDVVPFADIILSCTSSVNRPCEFELIGKADKDGVFTHEFDLPKVLEITASGNIYDTIILGSLPDTTMIFIKDTVCGTSLISIKPEQISPITITLYDCI